MRRATFTDRKPEPTGVVIGALIATLLRLIDSSTRSGIGVPSASYTSTPASCQSHSNSTPVASSTRAVASASSGPVPSPRMNVTVYATFRSPVRVSHGFAARKPRGTRPATVKWVGHGRHRTSPYARRAHPRGGQPGPAAGALQRLRAGPSAGRGPAPRGCGLGRGTGQRGRRDRRRRGGRVGAAGEREPAHAAHTRPLRPPDRRGGVPPRLAQADGRRRLARAPLPALDRGAPRRSRRARRRVHDDGPGGGRPPVPDLDDLFRRAGAASHARAGRRVGATPDVDLVRPAPGQRRRQERARSAEWR